MQSYNTTIDYCYYLYQCYTRCEIQIAFFIFTGGKQTVMDIMVMMDFFTMVMEKEKHLGQLLQLVTLLVVVSTMPLKKFSLRKIICYSLCSMYSVV